MNTDDSANQATIPIVLTQNANRPALWEKGGSEDNSGHATIIAGPHGDKLKAHFINRDNDLECGLHALLPLEVGNIVVETDWAYTEVVPDETTPIGYHTRVMRVGTIDTDSLTASVDVLFEGYETNPHRDPKICFGMTELLPAVQCAVKKSQDYHCEEFWYALLKHTH